MYPKTNAIVNCLKNSKYDFTQILIDLSIVIFAGGVLEAYSTSIVNKSVLEVLYLVKIVIGGLTCYLPLVFLRVSVAGSFH